MEEYQKRIVTADVCLEENNVRTYTVFCLK